MTPTRIAASATNTRTLTTAGKAAIVLAALALAPAAAQAADPAKGEADFKKCRACHTVSADDGTVIQKGGKTGPNLYGVIGRPVAAQADFKYGDSIKEVGAKGVIWDEALLAEYVRDPKAWLAAQLGRDAVKSNMTFKLAKGGEDMAAWLAVAGQ